MHQFLSCSLKVRPNCGLEVESLLQPSVCPHPQTQLGQHCCISTEPRTQSGDDVAEEKDPTAPVAEGLDPFCSGYCHLRKYSWNMQPLSPPASADSAFAAEGVVSSSIPGEISIGSWRIKAACIQQCFCL